MQVFVPCHQVNLKAHHVEYNHFYIPDITSLVDIQEDYLKWFLSKAKIVSTDVSHLLVTLNLHMQTHTHILHFYPLSVDIDGGKI